MNKNPDRNKRVKAMMLAGGMGMLPLVSSAAVVGSQRGEMLLWLMALH